MTVINRKNKQIITIILLLLVVITGLCLNPVLFSKGGRDREPSPQRPTAVNGVLDLTGWDVTQNGSVALSGEWEFYWGQLLEPQDFRSPVPPVKTCLMKAPEIWTRAAPNGQQFPRDGFATYRLLVNTKPGNEILTLKTQYMFSACRLWVNGKLLISRGVVGTTRTESLPHWARDQVSFVARPETQEVIIQISNFGFSRSGFIRKILLGTEKQIQSLSQFQLGKDMFLFGGFMIMGIYHLYLFILRRKDRAPLYSGIICLLVALRTLLMGEMVLYSLAPGWNIEVFLKLSMLAVECGLPVLIMLIRSLYPEETPQWFVRLAQVSGALFAALTILTPDGFNSYFLAPYEISVIMIAFGGLFFILRAMAHRRSEAGVMMLATGAFFLTVLYDVSIDVGILQARMVATIGSFALPCALALILARRFSKSFTTIEVLSERLLFLDKLKDEFLANTSHELRTPLNGIIGIAESMIEGAAGKLDPKQAYHLSMIASSGKRLAILVNDILDFSKLKNNEIVLQKKPVDIRQVVEIILALSAPLAAPRSLTLVNRLEEDLPLVDADENRAQQILHNLIGNAVKFTNSGSIEVSAVSRDGFLAISIADTGIGIPEDQMDRIFDSFMQMDGSISREYGGAGLGLNISKRLVELHGGTITVKSKVDQGSVFTFTLPLSTQSGENEPKTRENRTTKAIVPPPPQQSKPQIRGACRILVVDDEPVNRQVMINFLSLESYMVETATSGEEALKLLGDSANTKFDLAILDLMMPRMSGYQLCRRLRDQYSLIELPILVLTARNQTEDVIAGLESGANDYLAKPFEKRELLARVNMLLKLKHAGEQEKMLRQAELHALQAQIKPHFLLNTFNTIIYFCRTNPEKAGQLLTELGNYLRSCFNFRNPDELVTLEHELEIVRSYLAIIQARFNELIKIVYEIEVGFDCRIPPFILQPLVENAVKHGLLPKKEGGTVRIAARKSAEFLILEVSDDGMGMAEAKIRELLNLDQKHEGVGVNNVNNRLRKIYGQSLEIRSRPGVGTTVIIKIPWDRGKIS